ncbi:ATP-binding protein [Solirubrobacter soli]|uniref:ATP-binding protein n=1 Tax=Solirubrobacter soli TaxID=363832 RepID=UPI0003FC3F9C|nr:ATP-binding protein [Solirubrobacter soli]
MSTAIDPTGLAERLGLNAAETLALAVIAAPELDARYAHLRPTARLIGAQALPGLLARGAVVFGEAPLAVDRPLRLAPRLAAFLLGLPARELRRVDVAGVDPGREDEVARLAELAAKRGKLPLVVSGPDAAVLLARALDQGLILVGEPDADASLAAALEGRALAYEDPADLDALPEGALVLARADVPADRAVLRHSVRPPAFGERAAAWQALTGVDDVADVSAKFRLSIGQIEEAARVALVCGKDLDAGAREASSSRLGTLAKRLKPTYTWSDLVVAGRQRDALLSISAYLRHRDLVLTDWGYELRVAKSQGLKILFAGESGTGKTMAAQVLAADLGLDIFQVDLATIVSKYVGETEKNLGRIFEAAQGSNAILFFDEADALFGKRSEVTDAKDRYANIEVAYLLQRMEAYAGAVILATNFRRNIDDAFLRRLDFVIDFPFPEPSDRERLWRGLIPCEAPLGRDVDFGLLARRFKLSGGAIRNCTLAAAFLAAEEGSTIDMAHLVRAVSVEYAKLGRLTMGADFDGFEELIRPR